MKTFKKRYIRWDYSEAGAYVPEEFDTLKEALTGSRYTDDFYIVKNIDFEVREAKILDEIIKDNTKKVIKESNQ